MVTVSNFFLPLSFPFLLPFFFSLPLSKPPGIPMIPVKNEEDLDGRLSHSVIVTMTLLAGFLLVLNVVLITCYVRRKRRRGGGAAGGGGGGRGDHHRGRDNKGQWRTNTKMLARPSYLCRQIAGDFGEGCGDSDRARVRLLGGLLGAFRGADRADRRRGRAAGAVERGPGLLPRAEAEAEASRQARGGGVQGVQLHRELDLRRRG